MADIERVGDVMPAGFALGLAGSLLAGLMIWSLALWLIA